MKKLTDAKLMTPTMKNITPNKKIKITPTENQLIPFKDFFTDPNFFPASALLSTCRILSIELIPNRSTTDCLNR